MHIDMTSLAAKGAAHRLHEITLETKALLDAFPTLKPSTILNGHDGAKGHTAAPARETGPRKRRKMSKAQKKAVSVRMKAYWRARRSADAKHAAGRARKVAATSGRTLR